MKFWITSILLLTTFIGFSQVVETIYGAEYSNSKKKSFNGFIGESELAVYGVDYYNFSKKKHELIINTYHKSDLNKVDSKNIYSNPLTDFYSTPFELFYSHQQFYLFSKFYNHKTETTLVGLFIFDTQLNEINFEIIDTIDHVKQTELYIKEAKDNSGFLIVQSHLHPIANRQVLDLKALNIKGKTIWSKNLLSTNSVHNLVVEKIIHLEKETYILCNYGYTNQTIQADEPPTILSNKYTLWVYNHKLNFMKEMVLKLKSKWINGVGLSLSQSNQLIIAGYTNSGREFGINAVFSILLDDHYDTKKVTYSKLKNTDMLNFMTQKESESTTYLKHFYLRDVVTLKDDSFFILGEDFNKQTERVYDPRTNITSTTTHYNYNSILVSYFNKNGELQWHKRIAKFQSSIDDLGYYSSFSWQKTDHGIALVYNDNEKNTAVDLTDYYGHKTLFNNRRNAHVCVTVNTDGTVIKHQLNTANTNYLLYTKQSHSINNSRLFLKSEYGRHSKIVGVSFK